MSDDGTNNLNVGVMKGAEDKTAIASLEVAGSSNTTVTQRSSSIVAAQPTNSSNSTSNADPPPPAPPVYKRKLRRKPKGILKPAPPPAKAFSFRRDILQQLNTRLAQQGVNVQVPVPQGSLAGTAQGTAQAAGSLLGGIYKRVSGFAAAIATEENGGASGGQQRRTSSAQAASNDLADHASRDIQGIGSTSTSATSVARRQVDEPESSASGVQAAPTNNLPQPSSSARPLRKVRFTVTSMSVIYPISGAISPGEEDATRKRIEEEHRKTLLERRERRWTIAELEQLYRDCCRMREELPLRKMRDVFASGSQSEPPMLKTVDLSFVPLDQQAIEPIADLLSVEFGLQKLVLENCGLTDEGIKSILHALLVSGSLTSLSVASNKRIKYQGWRYIGIYMRRARALKYLDISENSINRASIEHILDALDKRRLSNGKQAATGGDKALDDDDGEAPLTVRAKLLSEHNTEEVATLTSLRMENCGLKTQSLELMGHAVRHSDLCHLSLRRNRINQSGGGALAIMLKDYPDSEVDIADRATPHLGAEFGPSSGLSQQQNGRSFDHNTPQRGREALTRGASTRNLSPGLPDIPLLVSSPGGGVTRRTLPPEAIEALREARHEPIDQYDRQKAAESSAVSDEQDNEAALALYHAQRAKRILSSMPRIGSLLTLDLKGNDIRGGVLLLSHALKKNRTLKVLNLSDNGIEGSGLVAIANALKYNSTLETLDMSHNPCSGPGLDGITTLRTAFTLNSNLKRLFLSDTDLSSEGAIALAEFLPEARSLIHLDLTENLQIDIAGVMAMAVSVKMNKSLRCLDLNIPPNAPDFARLSQDILSSCIRNTEAAQRRAQQKGVKAPIAAPIYKSTLARAAKEKEETDKLYHANQRLEQNAGRTNTEAVETSARTSPNAMQITQAASECVTVLRELLQREQEQDKERERDRTRQVHDAEHAQSPRPINELAQEMMQQSRQLRAKLKRALSVMQEGDLLEKALQVNDDLESITAELVTFYRGGSKDVVKADDLTGTDALAPQAGLLSIPSKDEDALSSPNFSIGSSDDEEEQEREIGNAVGPSSASSIVVSAVGSTLAGLGINESVNIDDAPKAAREAPSEQEHLHNLDAGTALVTEKAKGQLSEEGEIFRRARSLSIGGDEDEEEQEQELINRDLDDERKDEAHLQSGSMISDEEVKGAGVSGDELRKELLEKDVPRRRTESETDDVDAVTIDDKTAP